MSNSYSAVPYPVYSQGRIEHIQIGDKQFRPGAIVKLVEVEAGVPLLKDAEGILLGLTERIENGDRTTKVVVWWRQRGKSSQPVIPVNGDRIELVKPHTHWLGAAFGYVETPANRTKKPFVFDSPVQAWLDFWHDDPNVIPTASNADPMQTVFEFEPAEGGSGSPAEDD